MTEERHEIMRLLNAMGGEALEGSGFEDQTPDPAFAATDATTKIKTVRPASAREERADVD
jgi:hypothetical protein